MPPAVQGPQAARRHHHGLSAAVALLPHRRPLPPRLRPRRQAARAQALRPFAVRRSDAGQRPVAQTSAKDFGVRVTRTIADALTADGKLAVEGVLLIGEHGNYPRNDKGQILYPRFELMEQIVGRLPQDRPERARLQRQAPVVHLRQGARRWSAGRTELKFPLMAGSSLPVTWRRPELELQLETPIEDALVAGLRAASRSTASTPWRRCR